MKVKYGTAIIHTRDFGDITSDSTLCTDEEISDTKAFFAKAVQGEIAHMTLEEGNTMHFIPRSILMSSVIDFYIEIVDEDVDE